MNLTLKSLLLLLPILLHQTHATAPHDDSKDPSTDKSDLICHPNTACYPRHFVPTTEFQIVHDDQDIPPGLHVRLNMETGVKEAKLYDPTDSTEATNDVVIVDDDDAPQELPVPKGAPKEAKSLKDQTVKPPKNVAGDQGGFDDAVKLLSAPVSSSTEAEKLAALAGLEDLSHEIYWGTQLASPKISPRLLELATSLTSLSTPAIRSSAALVLGSSLSNNPKALAKTIEAVNGAGALLTPLLKSLDVGVDAETDPAVRSRLVFLLAQVVKDDSVRAEFLKLNGLAVLGRVFDGVRKEDEAAMKGRVAVLVEDTFLNKDMRSETATTEKVEATKELLKFCEGFAETVVGMEGIKGGRDTQAKVLSALVALKGRGKEGCKVGTVFEKWVAGVDFGKKGVEELVDEGETVKALVKEHGQKFLGEKNGSEREL